MNAGVLGAEFRRTIRLARSYWLEYIADLVLYTVGFLLLITVFRAASPDYGPEGTLSTLIGYTTWKICASVLAEIARIASDEAKTGTLEQLFLAGGRAGLVFAGRSLGIVLNHGLRGVLLAFILASFLNILPIVTPLAGIVFLLTLAGASGLGLMLAGLALVYKRIGGGLNLLWQMLVFFTGALAPIESLILGMFANLLPLTLGITCLRAILIEQATVAAVWQSGWLPGLLVNTLAYVAGGVLVFSWGERQARELGVLGHY